MLKTILVVEDDDTMRELLRLHLTMAGYAVRVAADGIEAGHAVLGVTPDTPIAIFMDRSLLMVIGILGILKAGGAYLPLECAEIAS